MGIAPVPHIGSMMISVGWGSQSLRSRKERYFEKKAHEFLVPMENRTVSITAIEPF